jgi:hypothetical protein
LSVHGRSIYCYRYFVAKKSRDLRFSKFFVMRPGGVRAPLRG